MGQIDINGSMVTVLPPQDDDDTQIRVRVRVRDLLIHPRAQRALRSYQVARLKKKFDIRRMVVEGVRYPREGHLPTLVVNGQHRYHAAMDLGLGDKFITMIIHTDVKNDDEAHELFLLLDDNIHISAIDRYRNQLGARHRNVMEIETVIRAHQLRVAEAGENTVRCPAALIKVHKRLGMIAMDTMFQILGDAWGYAEGSLDGIILDGLSQVIKGCSQLRPERMAERLKRYRGGPVNLMALAKGHVGTSGRIGRQVAMIMIEEYNVGLRNDGRRLAFKVATKAEATADKGVAAAAAAVNTVFDEGDLFYE